MAENSEEFIYDADASGLLDEFLKIESMIRRVNDVSDDQAKIISQVNSVFNKTVSQIKELIKQEQILALAGKEVEEGFKSRYVASKQLIETLEREQAITLALNAARTNSQIAKENAQMKEFVALHEEAATANQRELTLARQLQAVKTDASIADERKQREIVNQLMVDHAQHQGKIAENQRKLNAELQATRTNEQAIFEIEQKQQRLAAAAGRTIIGAGNGPSGPTGNNALGRALELIQSGKIDARRVVQIYEEVGKGINQAYTGVERTVQQTANTVVREQNRMAEESKKATNRITLTWKSLGRLLLIQNIHLAVYRFIAALQASIGAATQFEIKISEIRTISQESQLSFDKWATTVRRLSDEFGAPILDVAAGLYETISNQIAKGAEAAVFMSKAMNFARTTVSTTDEAVNLLSSALNSYNLKVQDADRVSAILFKTIDLGRVRASEMANTFGRVAGLAAPLGVSLEEVSAAIATLTINGVKYNEAYTLVNNILLKLLRPTKDMKDLLKEWGFSSGQAAVSGLTFAGVLRRLESEGRTSADEIGELLNQIRGIRGVLGLTGSAFQTFERDLAQISNASAEYQAAQAIAAESAGKRFEIEMNKIKNFFISDFGEPFIRGLVAMTETTDKAGNHISGLSDVFKEAIKWVKITIESFTIYKLATLGVVTATTMASKEYTSLTAVQYAVGIATNFLNTEVLTTAGRLTRAEIATLAFNRSISFLKANLGTIGLAGFAIGISYVYNEIQQGYAELARFQEEADARIATSLDKLSSIFNADVDKQTDAIKRGFTERYRATLDYSSKVRSALSKMADSEKKILDSVVALTKDAFAITEKRAQEAVRGTERLADKAQQNADKAREFVNGEGFDKSRFENQLDGLPDDAQINARLAKIKELREAAGRLLSGAKNKPPEEAARDQAQATKLMQQAEAQITALEGKRADAAKKIKEIEDKATEGAARDAYAKENAQLSEQIRLLESRHSKTSQDIKNLREIKARQAEIERERRSGVRDAQDQKELKTQEQVLKNIGSEADLAKLVADYEKQKTDAFLEYAAAQEKHSATLKKQAEDQAKQFELLKDAASEAGKFKLVAEGNNETEMKQSVEAQLKAFDEIMKKSVGAGADKDTQNQLIRQRKELEKQAAIELERRRLDDATERLAKEKDLAIKNVEDIANRKKDLEAVQQRAQLTLSERIKETLSAGETGVVNKLDDLAHSWMTGGTLQGNLKATLIRVLSGVEKTVSDPNKTPQQRAAALEADRQYLSNLLAQFQSQAGLRGIKSPDALGKGGREINDVFMEIQDSMRQLIQAQKDLAKFNETQNKLTQQLRDLNVREAKLNGLAPDGKSMTPEQQYNATIKNTTTNLQNFESAIINAARRLNSLGGAQGVSYVPNNLTPGVNTKVAGVSGSRTTTYGNINVTVQGTGNPNYDGAALAAAIARAQRLGQLQQETV